MLIKVLIVDDEFPARKYLSSLLMLLYPSRIVVVEECDCVKSAVTAIRKHKPDLIFLDIQMPEENGFELFNYFDVIDFEVIFTTAFKDFALNALKVSALDYLLKPLTISDVKDAIARYDVKLDTSVESKKLTPVFDYFNQKIETDKKLIISTKKGFEVINIAEIMYCKAEESYSHFYTELGNILSSKSFKDSCSSLLEPVFIKVHKSYCVNVNFIKSFNTSDFSLQMSNGETIPVSDKSFTKKRLMDAIGR